MRNLLISLATAALVFTGLAAAGLAASPFLLPDPPNIYRTSIFDITAPKGWVCFREVTESICRPDTAPPYRAILVAAMKFRNPEMDSLESYAAHVGKPIVRMDGDGKETISTFDYARPTVIEGRTWVDAVHHDSEIRGYKTRYLATVTVQVAILITFSAYEKDFAAYEPTFEKMVRSLNIYQRYNGADETRLD